MEPLGLRRRLRPLRTLQARLFVALALIGILPLAVVGLGTAALDRQEHTRHAGYELTGLARVFAGRLDVYLGEVQNDVRAISVLPEVVGMDPARQDPLLKDLFHEYPTFARLSTFDLAGQRLASSHPGGAPSVAVRQSFQTAAGRGQQAWEVAPALSTGRSVLVINTPIRDADRRVVGVVGAVVDLESLSFAVARVPVGGGGRTFVLDADGRVLLHPDPAAVQDRRDYAWLGVPTGGRLAGPGTIVYEWEGERRIAGYAPVPGIGWTVVVEQPEAEVLASVERAWRIAVAGLALSALLSLAAAIILARALTRPLRGLAAAARALGAGDSAAPMPKLGPGDGEVGALVEAFSAMREAVAARTAALERLHAASSALHHTADLSATLDELVTHACALTGAAFGTLVLREADELVARHSAGLSAEQAAVGRVPVDQGVVGFAYRTGEITIVNDPADPRLARTAADAWGIRTMMVVPLAGQGRTLGVLAVCNKQDGAFTPEECRLLVTLAGEVAIVLENAELTRLAAEADALRQLNHQKSLLLATVSHELRTPLTLVQGFSELLCTRSYSPEDVRAMCRWINEGAVRLSHVVDDILGYSEIEGGAVQLQAEAVLLADIVRQSTDLFIESGHPITIDLPPDLPVVLADSGRCRQILTNLVGNAIKFSPGGAEVAISARAEDGYVRVSVRDRGPGVPPSERERIFEPFYRTENTHAAAVPGTGLGLAIVRQLVRLHGGEVAVLDAPGGGSIFNFTLPVVE
ncbi:MAG: GAF domain-containing protein [Chloroflexi bacterium]|nr:GAF domain-containing protein [Chloroflexota bacterium]